MRRVGSRELKNRLGGYLRLVKQGEILLITERNRPVAQIVSMHPRMGAAPSVQETLVRLAEQGHLRLATQPLKPHRPKAVRGKSASRIILEDRR